MTTAFSLSFLAPVLLIAAALAAFRTPGRRPGAVPQISEVAALGALGLVALGLIQVIVAGPAVSSLFDGAGVLALRADPVSATLALLVAFIGWIVLRYSRTYLDGEAREGAFHGLMLVTLAAVLIFVMSGSLWLLVAATIATGLGLKRLLLFYADRPEARRAAAKFGLVWHGGDAALIAAALVLTSAHGTGDLSAIAASNGGAGIAGHMAAGLLVLAAILKTACFPLHGWLTEVMEAPTPVSALLHAGIINSGGVILIKTAPLVQTSPGAMAALVMIGGFTALFGAAVMLTQSAVKTSLAWSTVSQMGFMLLQCGLGLWALALLHIVAHSLYKAHAFLSSGGAVAAVAAIRKPGPVAVPDLGAVLKSFGLALLLYAAIAGLFSVAIGPKTAQALALGAILVFGVAYLVAQGLADTAPAELTRRTVAASLAATLAYFSFQAVAQWVWGADLPAAPAPGPLEWALIVLAVLSFGMVALAQSLFPLWAHHPATAGLRVHLANGLYLNALLDRAIGGFRTTKSS
ncbi:oxidoreductase [Ponticoccus sp. SC2-23]|uniref:proton-conducting transporter transmembrane domain-containing protein n=1 Tax=Alexandriicola marinus TaxID=2081710 RepID=UPI000FD9191E|nr:proton-conducting transporter membrane subunit [Alexandriicola marinus]MBM1218724.1 oxidoreductase [Ponticoccus sp. SC6-9]MBM1224204.1 oxidoreductase [Ponticoccus sp. SC6-15]MBM1230017.1 oxidoreductase [Ponticoccus sp. SC6-38]MBM1233170.1 oxidoreductase [Ponticoccus sp. SC6-45]MBM1236880.1 oxidoreductase [Ponticoccus sp. SC6-49]MBM1242181.1 oxidoreductase [Ponticoccus sp. SC2-64]MBM1246694.1 oxidoreductase [Ponticoccus sp. SC6-42]MBM1251172.1 oxidoreductase [Ponticoccus sp. SC6-33]MBM12